MVLLSHSLSLEPVKVLAACRQVLVDYLLSELGRKIECFFCNRFDVHNNTTVLGVFQIRTTHARGIVGIAETIYNVFGALRCSV